MRETSTRSAWNRFWFGEAGTGEILRRVRIGMSVVAILYFGSHWSDIARWFSSEGLLSSESLGQFLIDSQLGEAVRWRLSPLHWIESPWILKAYLLVGIGLAAAWPWITTTRAVGVALWLAVLGLANRSFLISGLEEVLLVWGLGYLAIAPADGSDHWTGSLALRLIQVHLSLWLAVTGLTMLTAPAWWDGTGLMALAAPIEDRRFDWTESLSRAWLLEGLTHAVVLGALAAPLLLWVKATRWYGFAIATLWGIVLGMITNQLLLFSGLVILLGAFLPTRLPTANYSATAATARTRQP